MPKYKTVVFVNGCFWHGHEGCKYFVWPENNADFWREKITTNIQRDANKATLLEQAGWRVLVVWECELKKDRAENTLDHLVGLLRTGNQQERR